jgi:mono/diheme cytochrome c family protein
MGGGEAPDLGRAAEAATFYALAADMWNHIPTMISRMNELAIERPRLTADEMADVVAFLFRFHYSDAPGDTAAGRREFTEKRCIMCHQVGGVGGVAGPDLSHAGPFSSPIQVAAAMWNHGPSMDQAMQARQIERAVFVGSDLVDLLAYLRSTGEDASTNLVVQLPGSASQGRRLYLSKGCAACHGPGGRGGGGPNLAERSRGWSLMDYAAAMWNKASAMSSEMQARGVVSPELTESEMADLVAYLYSLRFFEGSGDPGLGPKRIADKGCLDCHSLRGRGDGTGSELSEVPGLDSPAAVMAALWNHAAIAESIAEADSTHWPMFDDHEIADLVAFFQAGP